MGRSGGTPLRRSWPYAASHPEDGSGPAAAATAASGPPAGPSRLTPAVSADLPRSRLHPGAHAAGVPGRPGPQPGVLVVVQEGVGHLSLLEEEVVRQVRGPVPPSSSARRANSDPLPFPAAQRRRGRVFRPLWPTRKRPKQNSTGSGGHGQDRGMEHAHAPRLGELSSSPALMGVSAPSHISAKTFNLGI